MMDGRLLVKRKLSINGCMNNKSLYEFLLLGFVLLSQCVTAQIRVIDNKGTLSVVDTSKWVRVESTNNIYNKSNAKVGIGTSIPATALDVRGEVSLSGATSGRVGLQASASTTSYTLTLPAAKATETGQVLFSDSVGNLSWETLSSGGIISLGSPMASYLKGAIISGSELALGLANATNPGIVSTGGQTFAGNKIFSGSTTVFGSGEGGTPTTTFIRGPQAGGSGTAGADLYIQASNGTGAGGSGSIIFQTGSAATISVPTISNNVIQKFSTTTATFSNYTVSTAGTNRLLMVAVNLGYSGASASSITYGANSLSLLSMSPNNRMGIWYLVNPPTGVNNITVNLTNGGAVSIAATTWVNVNQSLPFGPVVSAAGYNGSVSLSPVSSLGQVVVDFLISTTSPTAVSGQSVFVSTDNGTFIHTNGYKVALSPNTTMSYSFPSGSYEYLAFAIQSSTSGGGNALSDALKINNSGNTVIASGKSLAFTDGGTGAVSLAAPISVTSDYKITLPTSQGSSGQALLNDGAGNLTWGTPTLGNTINGLTINSGALSGVTGYSQTSGSFTYSGTGTFSTGTGAVSLNGDVTLAAGKTLYIAGSTSGTIGLKGNGAVSNYTLTLPAAVAATNNQVLVCNSSGTLSWMPSAPINSGTANNNTLRWNGTAWVESSTLTNDNITLTVSPSSASTSTSAMVVNGNSLTTGNVSVFNANLLTSGNGLVLSSTGTGLTGSLLRATSNSTSAFSNGGIRFNFAGAHTGNGFQIDDATTAGTVMVINANALTTGTGLAVIGTSDISGSLVDIVNTGVSNSTNGLLRVINNNAATTGTVFRAQSNNTDVNSGLTVQANGNIGVGVAAPSASLHIEAGTTTAGTAPLKFDDGLGLAVIEKGTIEKDANVFYITPDAINRGLLPSVSYNVLNAAYVINATTMASATDYPIFPPTQDVVNLVAGTTYEFEAIYYLTTPTATTRTVATSFGGTAALSSIKYRAQATSGAASTASATIATTNVNSSAFKVLNLTNTNAEVVIELHGIIRVTSTGTFIPQIRQTTSGAALAFTLQADSFFKLTPIGTNLVTKIGSWQ